MSKYIKECSFAEAYEVASKLRPEDVKECTEGHGIVPTRDIPLALLSCTTEAFYVPDGRIAGLVGVYASGAIWMLCTKAVEDHPILFVKEAKAYIESRKDQRLFNICDKRNKLHLKLLKLLVFNFIGEVLHGPNNLPFIEFEKCALPPLEW